MKLLGFFLGSVTLAPVALAGAMAFDYRIGATAVTEDRQQMVIHAQTPVTVAILGGGKTWPPVSIDETGRIYAGGAVIDAVTGRLVSHTDTTLAIPYGVEVTLAESGYRFRRAGKECQLSLQQLGLDSRKSSLETLKDYNLTFASSTTDLLALVTQFGPDGAVAGYLVEGIDINRCLMTVEKELGNQDLLVELGHSEGGGWWITGSIEQTVFQSRDHHVWRKMNLPAGLSSLVSSYVVDEHEFWLAAILPGEEGPSPYLLVYSGDGGRHWRNIIADDPALARLPDAWLEGQKRRIPQ
jgi:hypothetical protein